MSKTIKIEPEKWIGNISNYFSHLSQDVLIAWAAVFVGIILIIVGLVMM